MDVVDTFTILKKYINVVILENPAQEICSAATWMKTSIIESVFFSTHFHMLEAKIAPQIWRNGSKPHTCLLYTSDAADERK